MAIRVATLSGELRFETPKALPELFPGQKATLAQLTARLAATHRPGELARLVAKRRGVNPPKAGLGS